jgi:feruloyl esterase
MCGEQSLWCCVKMLMIAIAAIAGGLLPLRLFGAAATVSDPASAASCAGLAGDDLLRLQDAPARVTEATLIETENGLPAHCRVRGYINPQIGFEILLPAVSWNEKFIEVGCRGFCGSIDPIACTDALRRSYACITSDAGHKGEDGLWAYNNLPAKVDWGYRGAHVVAIAGKAVAERYYGHLPSKSYFTGCSTGGRQAMVEAQRFPWDFNGIIAGAPPLNFTANSMAQLWATLAVKDRNGKSLLGPADAQLIHKAVLAKCDLDDGVRDGVLSDPRACRIDFPTIVCKGDGNIGCLTREQIEAVKKIYSGPFESSGLIAGGGFMPGSELGWSDVYFGSDGGPGLLYSYAGDKFRYAAFFPDAGPDWKPTDLNFEGDYKRLGAMESLYSATNPDLRQFHKAGGKLLVYQGWNDPLEPPDAVIDYYETLERVIGSRAATQDFFRLFMIPGMGHCVDGEGAWAIDYLSYLEEWVEKGRAPNRLVGGHVQLPQEVMQNLKFPLQRSDVTFSRPIYPYPLRAKYVGHGDPTDVVNFVAVH